MLPPHHAPRARTATHRKPSEPQLTLADHLEELRRRLGVMLLVLMVTVGGSFFFVERIIGWLRRPAEHLLPRFAFFTPTEPLVACIRVAGLSGLILGMPVVLWQAWGFVRSGLTRRERCYGLVFVWWGSLSFALGAAFAYYVVLPASLTVLLGIGSRYLEPVISIDRYLAFVTTMAFACALVFELPVVLFALAQVGVVTPEWLRQQRPYAILVLVIVAAVVTPTTDPVNLLLLAIPMAILYEASIVVTRWTLRSAGKGRLDPNA